MSMSRPNLWLAALLAVVSLVTSASAQQISPFIEPDHFEPDFQFFAPAEVSDFGGGEPPNVGFYFNYESTYVNVSRPEQQGPGSITPRIPIGDPSPFPVPPSPVPFGVFLPAPFGVGPTDLTATAGPSPFDGDFGWGNRYEIGYMTEEDVGYQIVHWHLNGPGEFLQFRQERLDRFDASDSPTAPETVVNDRNPREYLLKQSLNAINLSSTELNKVFRKKQFHNGAVLEPLVGLRYMTLTDYYRRDFYDRFIGFNTLVVINREVLDRSKHWFENNMLGAQLGFRLNNTYGHWNLSTEFRMFGMQNFQILTQQRSFVVTDYNPVAGLEPTLFEVKEKTRFHEDNQEFVWGGELRGEASYELTRDISMRFGFTVMELGQGIGRGGFNDENNDQNVFIGGATFGLTINR